ncbi:hypothetical protein [Nocardiopsis sp. HUAS JQ3]|uniref:hypothetical protein n=1 Tax=Nocardiopsis sp. HUAS JQ3 TaxID=3061629 RepID=UPI0023A95778|nr:hypothetical protein [Nocardiopsis sp. HUAS JQ3]WDZ91188.1 hypothetical protein PV789_01005 [Nocardiopsis sp. HUAS JQ3]
MTTKTDPSEETRAATIEAVAREIAHEVEQRVSAGVRRFLDEEPLVLDLAERRGETRADVERHLTAAALAGLPAIVNARP